MLIGQYESVLSQKKRVAIPAKFRRTLGSKIITAKWYEGCLVLVGEENWKALLEKLTGGVGTVTASVRDTDRFILGSAFEFEPDSQGRVVLSEPLVKYAKLGSNVVFLGLGDRVEVWDKTEWEKREKYVGEHAGEFIEKIAKEKFEKEK